jgi:small subunit ribosomal protein S4
MEKKPYPPGFRKARWTKQSDYAKMLKEKQKLRRMYGMQERQFRRFYERASRQRGATGENLLILLERRIDNVVYRFGWATSRAQARQMVNHGHIRVDGKKVDITSYLIKPGQVIEIAEKRKQTFKERIESSTVAGKIPDWLEPSEKDLSGKVVRLPRREDIEYPIDENLVVVFYSR